MRAALGVLLVSSILVAGCSGDSTESAPTALAPGSTPVQSPLPTSPSAAPTTVPTSPSAAPTTVPTSPSAAPTTVPTSPTPAPGASSVYTQIDPAQIKALGADDYEIATLLAGEVLVRAVLGASPQGIKAEIASGLARRAGTIELDMARISVGSATVQATYLNDTKLEAGLNPNAIPLLDVNIGRVQFADRECTVAVRNSHPNPETNLFFQLSKDVSVILAAVKCAPL